MNAKEYTYSVFYSPSDKEFVGIVEEFPGLSWLDCTQEAALKGIVGLVEEILLEYPTTQVPKPEKHSELALA